MKLKAYQRWIGQYGWTLVKASMDWKLYDHMGNLRVRNIIISHPGKEVVPISVKKTKAALNEAGLEL